MLTIRNSVIKVWEYSDYYIFEVEPNRYNLINKSSFTQMINMSYKNYSKKNLQMLNGVNNK